MINMYDSNDELTSNATRRQVPAPVVKNYHTHTWRCKHASGDVDDYCRAAVEQGLSVLGLSDHAALPDDRWPGVRMNFDELSSYCHAIDVAR